MGVCESKLSKSMQVKERLSKSTTSISHKQTSRMFSIPLPNKQQLPTLTSEPEHQHHMKRTNSTQSKTSHTKKPHSTSSTTTTTNVNDLVISSGLVIDCNIYNPKNQYDIITKLGEGGYGGVWKVRHKKTGLIRAMKRIPKIRHNQTKITDIINEIETLKQLDHPNIVKLFEFFIESDGYYLIIEYCSGGELFDIIKQKHKLPEAITANIMYQIFNAVNYCHKTKKVIHRDLKPENILIESIDQVTGYYNIKIIDFGTAKIYEHNRTENKIVGSTYYIAPEVLNQNYNEKCDIWSCGVILYMLLSGKLPFNGETSLQILQKIKTGKYDLSRKPFDTITTEAKDLIQQCLELNVKKRINSNNALNHKWFDVCDTKRYFCEINDYFYNKIINNLISYKPKNKLQEIGLTYLVHNFPNLDEIKNINKVYANINKNKNGKLTKYEAKKAFKEYLNTSTTEELNIKVDEIFNNIDNDKNGYIENEEFARAALDKSIFLDDKVLKFIFDFLDKDGSGQINFDEMKTVFGINNNKEAESILVSLIKDIDTDNNGEISFNEFKKMMINIIHY